jgi:hypothetical protein
MTSATAAASAATAGSSRNEVIDPLRETRDISPLARQQVARFAGPVDGDNYSPHIADHRGDALSAIKPHQQPPQQCIP